MKAKFLKKILLTGIMTSGLTCAQTFADSIDFDFYVNDPSITITFNQMQPFNSGYTASAQAKNELLYPVNFNGQMIGSSTLADSFTKNYPNHIGLNTKDSNPDALDVEVKINMSINGSPVLDTGHNDSVILAHEHKSDHNWFIATSNGSIFQGGNKNHSDWGLNISTQDGNQYCLKAVNLDYAAVLYKGACNNSSTYSTSSIGANSSGRYDFSNSETKTFTFSSTPGVSKIIFTYDGTHDGIYCISNCKNFTTGSMTEQLVNITSSNSGNNLSVNILSNLRSSLGDGTNYVPVDSFNNTFSPYSKQFSFEYNYNKSGDDDTYTGLQAAYFVVDGNLAITDSNNVTTTFPISLAYSRYNFGWNLGSAMGNSIHNRKMTLTNNGTSYCLTGNNSNGSSAIVSQGVCPLN